MKLKFKYLFLFSLSLSLFFACKKKSDYESMYHAKFTSPPMLNIKRHSTINIPTNGNQYNFTAIDVLDDGSNFQFWGLDQNTTSIYTYDLKYGQFLKKIQFDKEGPLAVPNIYDFHVQSMDSIYLHTNEAGKLLLANSSSEIIKQWTFPKELPDGSLTLDSYLLTIPQLGLEFNYDNNKNTACFNIAQFNDKELYRKKILAVFSLNTNTFSSFFGEFPPNYIQQDKQPTLPICHFILIDDTYAISFPESHYLHFYVEKGLSRKVVPAKSRFLEDRFDLPGKDISPQEDTDYFNTHGFYMGIYYDKYKKCIYRIVKHPQERKDHNGLINTHQHSPWSIMKLDLEGNVLGETDPIQGGLYDYFMINVTKKGLLLSRENDYNPDNNEETLDLEIINLFQS